VDNDQAFTLIALQAHDFSKRPHLLHVPIATAHTHQAEIFRMVPPQLCGYGIHAPPLALPLDMLGAFHLADPVFAHAFNEAG
jgi:hypothetical protein